MLKSISVKGRDVLGSATKSERKKKPTTPLSRTGKIIQLLENKKTYSNQIKYVLKCKNAETTKLFTSRNLKFVPNAFNTSGAIIPDKK